MKNKLSKYNITGQYLKDRMRGNDIYISSYMFNCRDNLFLNYYLPTFLYVIKDEKSQ